MMSVLGNESAAGFEAVEAVVRDLWESVFPTRPIQLDDNFFDLGGHSLTAVRMSYKLESLFHFDLPAVVHFDYPTIRELSRFIVVTGKSDGVDVVAIAAALTNLAGS